MTDTKPMTGQTQKDLGSSGSVASSGPDSQCPTLGGGPVLSLNEAYQRICDLFAYEENEKALNDGLLHILRMATQPASTDATEATMTTAQPATSDEGQTETASVAAAAPALKPEGG